MDAVALFFHRALASVCAALAAKHPEHAGIYTAIPWVIYAVFLLATMGVFVRGVVALRADFRRIFPQPEAANPLPSARPGDKGFALQRVVLPDGTQLEPRYTPRGELDHYEPVRHGESVATIVRS